MKIRSLPIILLSILTLSVPGMMFGQSSDTISYEVGTRDYWKHMNSLQKEKFNEFKEWQKQFLNVTDSRYSLMFAIGYGLPIINQKVEAAYPFLGTSIRKEHADGSVTEEGIYTTDGKGFRAMIVNRYLFNPFAAMEMGIGIEWYDEIPNGSVTSPTYTSSINSKSYGVTITPQLVLTSPNLRNFYVYGRIGLYMPIWGGSRSEIRVVDQRGTLIREFLDSDLQALIDFGDLLLDYEEILGLLGYKATLSADVKVDFYKNTSVIGFQTAVGFRYQFSKKWGVVCEYFHGGYAPFLKKSEVKDLDLTVELFGRDILVMDENGGTISLVPGNNIEIGPEFLGSTLNVNYYQELDENSNNSALNPGSFDSTQPSDELTDKRLAYSNGFFIGIQYNLPGRAERGKTEKRKR